MEKFVLIGAGSALFMRGLVADIVRRNEECDLALVDVAPEALQAAEQLARKMIEARKAPIGLSASTDRREALNGATVVICTIAVGGAKASEQDGVIPRKYGVFQTIADTVMPGGTVRALRMIPVMVAVAEDVCDLAPTALFFSYSNPMTPLCRAVRKVTDAPLVGLCSGVDGTARHLARALGVTIDEVSYAASGINHLTWFTEFQVNGKDAMPDLHRAAAEKLASLEHGAELYRKALEEVGPFSWQLFEAFGAYPAPGDRHVIEFFPHLFRDGKYYGKTLGVDVYNFESWVEFCRKVTDEMRLEALSKAPLPDNYFETIGGERSMVVDMLESIRRDAGRVYSVNLPNRGQIPNLPDGAIVESPAVADRSGLRSVPQRPLPSGVVGTMATRLAWVETVVEAALEGSREKFIQALVLDGAADSIGKAAALADEFLVAQAEYLPQFRT